MLTTRSATVADVPQILRMLRDSADDQGSPGALIATESNLREDGFGEHPRFRVLLAEQNGAAAGLALYYFNYSTWISRNGLYLEDLYVKPDFRRTGIARALMSALAAIAQEHGCKRMSWVTLQSNSAAIEFYRALGARFLDNWLLTTLSAEALHSITNASSTGSE